VENYLSQAPEALKVDLVCAFTGAMIADEDYDDLFYSSLESNPAVYVISTVDLKEYARDSGCSYAKAVLRQCISAILTHYGLETHPETFGCPLDFCFYRDDIKVGLRKMSFDHKSCRSKVKDPDMLRAVDELFTLELPEHQSGISQAPD
jgi:hypothetical protein